MTSTQAGRSGDPAAGRKLVRQELRPPARDPTCSRFPDRLDIRRQRFESIEQPGKVVPGRARHDLRLGLDSPLFDAGARAGLIWLRVLNAADLSGEPNAQAAENGSGRQERVRAPCDSSATLATTATSGRRGTEGCSANGLACRPSKLSRPRKTETALEKTHRDREPRLAANFLASCGIALEAGNRHSKAPGACRIGRRPAGSGRPIRWNASCDTGSGCRRWRQRPMSLLTERSAIICSAATRE